MGETFPHAVGVTVPTKSGRHRGEAPLGSEPCGMNCVVTTRMSPSVVATRGQVPRMRNMERPKALKVVFKGKDRFPLSLQIVLREG